VYFRQFRDAATDTFSYLFGCEQSGTAILLDPVVSHVSLYLGMLDELGLELVWVTETHLHADHISAADTLRERTGVRIAVGRKSGIEAADRLLEHGEELAAGDLVMRAIEPPGHSPGCVSYRWLDRVFTGDSLLIGGCGRIDEPGGNGALLYDSVTRRLLTLPDETLVYPGHSVGGRWVSCVGEERENNRLFHGTSRDSFVAMRSEFQEPLPALMSAVRAANRRCGRMTAADLRKGVNCQALLALAAGDSEPRAPVG
jgi:glyoxylase-like metal-dependent hydrolase (beta-lactamase superfamily II)